MPKITLSARQIAERGAAIYERKYRAEYEQKFRGQFAAIDIDSESAYIADFPEKAIATAKAAAPHGVFYLIRIGALAAFKTSRLVAHAASRSV